MLILLAHHHSLCTCRGDLKTVKQSLAEGGSPNWFFKPDEGAAALHKAAEAGHAAVIEALLEGGSVLEERILTNHNSPLHIACDNGHLEAAQALLKAGASVNIGNAFGNSPLHACIMASKPSVSSAFSYQHGEQYNAADCAAAQQLLLHVQRLMRHMKSYSTPMYQFLIHSLPPIPKLLAIYVLPSSSPL
jgi:Ankyrin repeats (3 copies)